MNIVNCPSCGGLCESGDRFCQDCGVLLAAKVAPATAVRTRSTTPDSGKAAGAGTAVKMQRTLPQAPSQTATPNLRLVINRAPAEMILVAAVGFYVISTVIWCGHTQLAAAFSSLIHGVERTMTSAGGQMGSFKFRIPSLVKQPTAVATKGGAPVVKETTTVVETQQPATVHPPAAAQTAAVKPAEALGRTAQSQTPQQQPAAPTVSQPTKSTAAVAAPAAASAKAAGPGEIKDLAEYNRLLGNYFSRRQDEQSTGSEPEPPTYDEWISANKPAF